MSDRLTFRINDKVYFAQGRFGETTLAAEMETDDIRMVLKKLADYEDKETPINADKIRVMRRCKGITNVYENGRWHRKEFELGFFHQWGCNYEEFESGAGNYSVAIVELPDGTIVMPIPEDITFLDTIENEHYKGE